MGRQDLAAEQERQRRAEQLVPLTQREARWLAHSIDPCGHDSRDCEWPSGDVQPLCGRGWHALGCGEGAGGHGRAAAGPTPCRGSKAGPRAMLPAQAGSATQRRLVGEPSVGPTRLVPRSRRGAAHGAAPGAEPDLQEPGERAGQWTGQRLTGRGLGCWSLRNGCTGGVGT